MSVQVLHTLGDVNKNIGTSIVRTKTPNLSGIHDVPAKLASKKTGTSFWIIADIDLALFDRLGKIIVKRHCLDVQAVVFVLGFRKSDNGGLGLDSFTIRNNRVGELERNTGVIVLKILEAIVLVSNKVTMRELYVYL